MSAMAQQLPANVQLASIRHFAIGFKIHVSQIRARMVAIARRRDSLGTYDVHARVVSPETDVKIKYQHVEAY